MDHIGIVITIHHDFGNVKKSCRKRKGTDYARKNGTVCDLLGGFFNRFDINSRSAASNLGDAECLCLVAVRDESALDGGLVLPDSVMTIGERAFRGSGIISANIGSGVISIGEQAFAKCTSLTAINVGSANAMYSSESGVLFNREMTTLMCYPSGKTDRVCSIPKSVTRISTAAFSECKNLREISFGGTKKQWESVYVCAENDSLDSSYISFAPDEK